VGGFFRFGAIEACFSEYRNEKKPNAAEQRMAFFLFLVGYKGTSVGFFRR